MTMNQGPANFSEMSRHDWRELAFSQEKLAQFLGVSIATVKLWVEGRTVLLKRAQRQFVQLCGQKKQHGAPNKALMTSWRQRKKQLL